MPKRSAGSDDSLHPKRPKLSTIKTEPETERHEIRSSQDLQSLLAFDHHVGLVPRQNVQSFKSFLASIAYAVESVEASAKRSFLHDYLQSQMKKESAAFLEDIIKTWHFAAQSNANGLFASVTAMLALLLETISSFVDFREHGNRLCTVVLHDDQIKLLDRGLDTHRAKAYLISPCLQLLTQVVVFNGGYAASRLYRQGEFTFRRLNAFLRMHKDIKSDNVTTPKGRSVRENALEYLFTNLRLQSAATKMNIIAQEKVFRALLDDMVQDSPSIALEILEVFRREIAMDGAILPSTKGRFFNQWTLSRLTTLYEYNESASLADANQHINRSVHDLLLFLCTSPGCGLIGMRHGSDSDLSQPDLTNKLEDENRLARKNLKLQQFLQSLRPYANVPQRDLILAVFRNMPGVVPDYFSEAKTFSFDPKLTMTWIGYSSFLLAAVAVPLPESLTFISVNDAVPALCGTIMDSVIPKPCSQKTLTRCLNQSVNLVKFFTLQILNAAFEKFAKAIQMCEEFQYKTDDQKNELASCELMTKLHDDFCRRVPELRHIVSLFRSCPKECTMLRESTARLITFYYKLMPHVALEEKLDMSVSLATVSIDLESLDEGHEQSGIRLLELEHLLEVAHRSPNVRWWHKPASMWLSPFTTLLRFLLHRKPVETKSAQLGTLLNTVATESHILCSSTSRNSLNDLLNSLREFKDWKASGPIFEFLDHCISHLVKRPVHYYDILAKLIADTELDIDPRCCQVDLLLITMMDQWHFLVECADTPTVTNVSKWLVRYIEVISLENIYAERGPIRDDTTKLLSQVRDRLKSVVQDMTCCAIFETAFKERPELENLEQVVAANTISEARHMSRTKGLLPKTHPKLEIVLPPGPTEEREDHPGLHQWSRQDIQDAIREGHMKSLVLCLCSKYGGIRKQALTGLRGFMMRLKISGYGEWQQMYMLVGEIAETAANIIANDPLPYYAGVLAADLFSVLGDPLHLMYAKVNEFLNRGPEWNVAKLPSLWMDKILMKSPTDDDGYFQEAEWLLGGLVEGLRTSADMDIFRKCHVFERLLSFSASPLLPEPCFQKILDLLFRCTYVGGSSTLITRCGLMSWIVSHLASHATNELTGGRLKLLASRAYETSDHERVDDWAHGTILCTMDDLHITQRQIIP